MKSHIVQGTSMTLTRLLCSLMIVGFLCLGLAPILAAEITLVLPLNAVRQELLDTYVMAFGARYPDVKINLVHGGDEKVQVMAQGGLPPQVEFVTSAGTPAFADKGMLIDLQPYLARDKVSLTAFHRPVERALWYREGVYGVPGYINPALIFYNPDIFARAGIPAPPGKASPSWTWEAIRVLAKKMTIDENGDGVPEQWGASRGPLGSIALMLSGFGASWFNEDVTKFTGDSENAVRALQFFADWYLQDRSITDALKPWNDQQAALAIFRGANAIPVWESRGYSWELAPMPYGQKAELVGTVFRFFTGAPDIQLAWEFTKPLVLEPAWAADMAGVFGGVPSLRTALAEYAKKTSWVTPRRLNILVESINDGEIQGVPQFGRYYSAMYTVIEQEVKRLITGGQTPLQTVDNIRRQANAVLAGEE